MIRKQFKKNQADFTELNKENVLDLIGPLVRGEQSFTKITYESWVMTYYGDQFPAGPGPDWVQEANCTFTVDDLKRGGPSLGWIRVLAVDGDTIWVCYHGASKAFKFDAAEGYYNGEGTRIISISTDSTKKKKGGK